MTTIASPSVCSRVADLAATRIALWQEGYLTGDSAAVADLARLRRGAGSHAAETPDLRSLVDTGPREPSARRRASDRIRDEFGPGVIRPTTLLRVGGPVQPPRPYGQHESTHPTTMTKETSRSVARSGSEVTIAVAPRGA
jgi:hypothetical protein